MKLYTSPDGRVFILDNIRFVGTVERVNVPITMNEMLHESKWKFMLDQWSVVVDTQDEQNTERDKVMNLLNS